MNPNILPSSPALVPNFTRGNRRLGGAVILTVGLADALLKAYTLGHFPDEQTVLSNVEGQYVLAVAIHRNPGIAFDIPVPLLIVLPITLMICVVFARIVYTRWKTNPAQAVAALAAVIGALGNAVDRLINGFTTDYIILFRTSAINLSDVLILLGILGVIWYDKRIPSQTPKA